MAATGSIEIAGDADRPDQERSEAGPGPTDEPFGQPRLALLALLAAVAIPILVATISAARQPWLPTSDQALIFIRALDVPSHLPLTGAYSRFGFDHPGPLLFWTMAAPAHLVGPTGMLLTTGALNAAAATGCCYLGWRRGGVALATLTAIAVLLFAHAMGDALVDPWNPWVGALPYLLAVLAAWGVSQRDWWLLPWLVVAASYAAQAHVSYAPFAGLLVVASFGWALVARFRRGGTHGAGARPSGLLLGITAGVLVLLWLAPLVQQFQSDGGNLTKLAEHFVGDHRDEASRGAFTDMSLPDQREVLGIVARELGALPPWTGAPEAAEPFTGNVTGANLLLLPGPFIVFAVAAVLAWRRRRRDALALQAIALGLVVLSAIAMTRIMGGLAPYIVRWTWVPACALTLSIAWAIARVVGAGAAEPGTTTRSTRSGWSRWTTAAVAVVSLLANVVGIALHRVEVPIAGPSDMAIHIIDATQQGLPAGKEVRVYPGGSDGLPVAAGIEAELIRRGVPIVVEPDLVSRYGAHRLGSDPHPATVAVVAGADQQTFVPAPTQRLVTTYDPLNADERRAFDDIRARLVKNYVAMSKGEPLPTTVTPDESARYVELATRGQVVAVYIDPGS